MDKPNAGSNCLPGFTAEAGYGKGNHYRTSTRWVSTPGVDMVIPQLRKETCTAAPGQYPRTCCVLDCFAGTRCCYSETGWQSIDHGCGPLTVSQQINNCLLSN